jgi:hypothetical protein
MMPGVTNWLSFWSFETRERGEEDLHGELVASIYVPYGDGKLRREDTIYCVAVEDGGLRLLTRLVARTLGEDDDPDHHESVRVDDDGEVPVTDYDRVVPPDVLAAIRFAHADESEHGIVTEGEEGDHVDGHRFQGRSSLRCLVAGAAELDALLADADPASRAVSAVKALADDYDGALDLLEDFCERFYWIKDHLDYQAEVREFLTARGREPRGIG